MKNRDASLVISFNGEIYNYQGLRAELEREGHVFDSTSDTEVLLRLYEVHGPQFVGRLRGMFAFALWDARKRGLLLARDPFGIKPLYIADDGSTVLVASEVKGLLASGHVSREPEPAGHAGFFLWGHVPEPYTLYKAIRSLTPGSTFWIGSDGTHTARRTHDVAELLAAAPTQEETTDRAEVQERIGHYVRDSVRHHLVADVDVGVFLSAGRDSATLAALAAETGTRLRTVTLGFEEFRGTPQDETVIAEQVARDLGSSHQTVWITRGDFELEIGRLMDRMDQPSIDGVNTYFVALAARRAGLKVALSGLGGDELFGGYPSFHQLPRLVATLGRASNPRIGKALRVVSAPLLSRVSSPKYASLIEYGADYAGAYMLRRALFLPWEIEGLLDADVAREGLETLDTLGQLSRTESAIQSPRLKVSALETTWYMRNQLLRDTDWASMSHSVEVRVPLVDWQLWSEMVPLLNAHQWVGKHELAMTPRIPLRESVVTRPKTGFVTPTRHWTAGSGEPRERGLRHWAHKVYRAA